VSGGLDLLLLDPVLDGLGINELLELLLLSNQEMVLVSSSLGRDGVVSRGNILAIDNRDGEVSRGSDELALLVECGLFRVGVQDGGDGLSIDNSNWEICWRLSSTEGIVRASSSRKAGREDSLGASSGNANQSS